jgi:hypothetical protein
MLFPDLEHASLAVLGACSGTTVAMTVVLLRRSLRFVWITLPMALCLFFTGLPLLLDGNYRATIEHEMGLAYLVARCLTFVLPLLVLSIVLGFARESACKKSGSR